MKSGSRKKGSKKRGGATACQVDTPAVKSGRGSRLNLVCHEEYKRKNGQPNEMLRLLSPCYCTYSVDDGEARMVIVGTRLELECILPFGEFALQKPLPDGDDKSKPFRIGESEKQGLGMFATRLIRAGELIIAERPTVLASKKVSPEPSFNDAALAALSDGARASFMALADSCSPELSHPLLGRIAINSFDSGPMTDDEDTLVEFAATYITLSRANHDCVGNANYQWLKTRWCGQFFAKRDIPAGEEITVSYTFALTQAERHAALKERYSCECLCKTCSDATPEDVRRSDQQRKMVAHVRDALQSALYSSLCPTVSEESLQRVLEHAQEEGMMISYATIAFLASRMLTKREGPVVALKWLKVARQAYVTTLGKEAWEVSQVDKHGWFLTTVLRSRGAVYSWP